MTLLEKTMQSCARLASALSHDSDEAFIAFAKSPKNDPVGPEDESQLPFMCWADIYLGDEAAPLMAYGNTLEEALVKLHGVLIMQCRRSAERLRDALKTLERPS
jgi:hypothetical protein